MLRKTSPNSSNVVTTDGTGQYWLVPHNDNAECEAGWDIASVGEIDVARRITAKTCEALRQRGMTELDVVSGCMGPGPTLQ